MVVNQYVFTVKIIIILFAQIVVSGMTKIKMGSSTESPQSNGNDFVERRRAALERYLKRTAQHPVLIVDPDFREFLESGIT